MRTIEEAARTSKLLELNGLKRGKKGLKIIMMCELPSNALMAKEIFESILMVCQLDPMI